MVYNRGMPILDLSSIKSQKELETRAKRDLEGKTLKQIMASIIASDSTARVSTKAGVGYVIEEGYFGIKKNNTAGPDIPSLGVEIKTSPLEIGGNGKLRVKEPLSLNLINYIDEYKHTNIRDSSFYKKNKSILFVWYIHDKKVARSEYVIKYVFLWQMDDSVLAEINDDYQKILKNINLGKAHQIHQDQHKNLTLCPKHGGKFSNPNCKKTKKTQPFSTAPAEVRAFRLKSSYMNQVIRKYLAGDVPGELSNFV